MIEWVEREYEGKKEVFAMRRSFDGWRVVYPMKNQDGTYNWKNIVLGGSWGNMFKWLGILLLILLFFYVYDHDTKVCRETMKDFGANCLLYTQMQNQNITTDTNDYNFINFSLEELQIDNAPE